MAREAVLRVRLSEQELEAAELRSVELGYENVSQFVRAAIRGGATSPTAVAVQAALERSAPVDGAPAGPKVCSRPWLHKKGTRCGYCQQYPTKDGE